ncbi:hypothetical protein GF377_11025 [candidate division GN15 bacterium]|nr:hypothetical protein [candidate division GN15 bacterium]
MMGRVSRREAGRAIPLSQELARKATHMGALVIPTAYAVLGLSKLEMLLIMVPITVIVISGDIARIRQTQVWFRFIRPVLGRMVRSHESADFIGGTYILLSVCCCVALYDKWVAIAALSFIIVGDTFAAIIGRTLGRIRFGRKTVEGSIGCLIGTVAVALAVHAIPLWIGLTGAVVATIVEAISIDIDDNLSVPIVSGLVMTLLLKF